MIPLNRRVARLATSAAYRSLALVQLRELAGFERIPRAVLERWTHFGDLLSLGRGEALARGGRPCRGLMLLIDGAAVAGRALGARGAQIAAFLGPSELIGLVPLLLAADCLLDVVAHEPSIVLAVPLATVREDIQQHFGVAQAFALQLAHRSRALAERLLAAGAYPFEHRLKGHLCYLAQVFGVPRGRQVDLGLRGSQAELARLLGVSRQRVNAELRALQDRGLISVARETVRVLDLPALRAAACPVEPLTLRRGQTMQTPPAGAALAVQRSPQS